MCIAAQIISKLQQYSLCSYFLVASGIFGVAVAAFLVALCPDALCISHQDGQLTAIPVCPPDNGESILYPKPENCSEFYQSSGGVAFTHHCPVNLYYCPEKEYCTWRTDTDCAFDCVYTKTNPVPASEENVPSSILQCPLQENDTLMLIHNPDDCSTYYECNNGMPVLNRDKNCLYDCIFVQN
jgi:hypothetical protein